MNKFKQTSQSPIGTSFHDTVINASVNDLTKVLGEPQYDTNHGTDKVNFEWMMELNDGSVFTVYDWKEYRVLDKREIIGWHIGGLNGIVTERAKEFILEALQGVRDEWDKVIDNYKETQYKSAELTGEYKAWEFEDRCGNTIVVTYLIGVKEFKSGYKVHGEDSPLIFDPKSLEDQTLVKPCSDDRKVNTVYKILVDEVIPKYLLNKKPNRIIFNPVSKSRERLVSILINKAIQQYPELTKKDNYIIYI